MNCKEVMQLLSEFIDGELDSCHCEEITAHIEQCPQCRVFFSSFKNTVKLCRECLKTEIPEDTRSRLRKRLNEENW